MTTQAITSQGVELQVGNGASPEVFSAICDITNFDGPSQSADPLEASSLCSTSKEFIPGLRDGGDLTLGLNFAPANTYHKQLQADLAAGVVRNYRIALSDSPATTYEFTGFVTAFGFSASTNSVLTASCTIKVTGDVVEV